MALTTTRPHIWWQETGSGEPLLLIMGKSFDSRMWHRAVAALSRHYRVLSFDNRGIGRSRTARHAFGIPDLAGDALAVLDAAGVDRAHVYGASMGGVIAQEVALSSPERVRSLVLACTGAPASPADAGPLPRRVDPRRMVPRALVLRLLPTKVADALYGENPPAEAVRDDLRILASTHAPAWVIAQQTRAVAGYESHSRVSSLQMPTLVLHGNADKVVPLKHGEELAALIPGAQLHVLDGAGHNFLTSVDGEANTAVLSFLAEVDERERHVSA